MLSANLPLPPQMEVLVSRSYQNKIPQTGWLNQQKSISRSSGGRKFKIKGLPVLVSPKPSLLGSMWLLLTVSSHGLSSAHLTILGISSSYKEVSTIGLGPQFYDFI